MGLNDNQARNIEQFEIDGFGNLTQIENISNMENLKELSVTRKEGKICMDFECFPKIEKYKWNDTNGILSNYEKLEFPNKSKFHFITYMMEDQKLKFDEILAHLG